jgi:hypothetical protein
VKGEVGQKLRASESVEHELERIYDLLLHLPFLVHSQLHCLRNIIPGVLFNLNFCFHLKLCSLSYESEESRNRKRHPRHNVWKGRSNGIDGLGKSTLFKLSGGGEDAMSVWQEVRKERSHLHRQELQSSLIACRCSLLYTLRLVLHEDPS